MDLSTIPSTCAFPPPSYVLLEALLNPSSIYIPSSLNQQVVSAVPGPLLVELHHLSPLVGFRVHKTAVTNKSDEDKDQQKPLGAAPIPGTHAAAMNSSQASALPAQGQVCVLKITPLSSGNKLRARKNVEINVGCTLVLCAADW